MKPTLPVAIGAILTYACVMDARSGCEPLNLEEILLLDKRMHLDPEGQLLCELSLKLTDDFKGRLFLNDLDGITSENHIKAILNDTVVSLTPSISADSRSCSIMSEYPISSDRLIRVDLPDSIFEIAPEYIEVSEIDIDEHLLETFSVAGAWHMEGNPWTHQGMFSIIDDDSLDGQIKSSSQHGSYGYFSLLYPLLESLGLRGIIAAEGRRMGINQHPPVPNDNLRTLVRLQDEKGWEVMSHSMTCIGEILNNWMVDSLGSKLATQLLRKGPYEGEDAATISVYDLQTRKQYWPNADNTSWTLTPSEFIKPYVGNYNTNTPILFNPDYDFDWHWGEWEKGARENGVNPAGFVTHNTTSSHLLVAGINKYFPQGFSDLSTLNINTPPMLSSAVRAGLEGQSLKGYDGNVDNTFNDEHFKAFCSQIDEAAETGGWIAFNLHAYRTCWKNQLPGALVSEGGTYPDEWVIPMKGIDSANAPYSPPASLGIKEWSEWYPCPGTRLHMMWELLKYAKQKGLINVVASEGFRIMGNRKAFGYFSKGHRVGQDARPTIGIRERYPHYIVGANDEVYYYNPLIPKGVSLYNDIVHVTEDGRFLKSGRTVRFLTTDPSDVEMRVMDTSGKIVMCMKADHIHLDGLAKGVYVVVAFREGRKLKSVKAVI